MILKFGNFLVQSIRCTQNDQDLVMTGDGWLANRFKAKLNGNFHRSQARRETHEALASL